MVNTMRHKVPGEGGFTLIELLVVILIIGILAAIAVPMFLNQRKSAVDASLQSDLKNVATWYQSWRTDPSHTNSVFNDSHNRPLQFSIDDTGASVSDAGLPEIQMSEGNTVRVVVVDRSYSPHWTEPHEEGEVCLAGRSEGGNYVYDSGAANHHQQLYYDSTAGGVKTMEELSQIRSDGGNLACYAFVSLWDNAIGGG